MKVFKPGLSARMYYQHWSNRSRKQPKPLRQSSITRAPINGGESHTDKWSLSLLPRGIGTNVNTDNTVSRWPLFVIAAVSSLLFMVLVLQLIKLQVVEGERMRGIAEGNRIREQVIYAPRGRILDRNGVVLADNTASFQVSVTPYLLPESETERRRMYQEIGNAINSSAEAVLKAAESEGLDHLQPVLVAEGLSRNQALQLEYIMPETVGFSLSSVPIRSYKTNASLAHILGYVGRVAREDLDENPDLYPIDFIGKMGVEAEYDHVLRGSNGMIETEVDATGRPLRVLRQQETRPGQDMQLTIDYELQQHLAGAVKKQMNAAGVDRAAGVILNPDSGEVLAMVSFPDYNNNLFAEGIPEHEYQQLINNDKQPMLNRVSSGGYPSGSIIKPFGLLGALETNTVTDSTIINDAGSITVTSVYDPSAAFVFRGWNPAGLGPMNARRAIAMSSNIYFYTVAGGYRGFNGMGIDNLVKYYRMFGLGQLTGIDLPNETDGRVPTPEWKQEYFNESWFIGDTYNLAIGQGNLLVSPLQMARAYSTIANGGDLIKPYLRYDRRAVVTARPKINSRNYRIAQEGMRQTVTGGGTTSPAVFAGVGVPVAGKSGTAETNPGDRKSHAWFSAYAPYDNPELLSVVLLEEGEGGSAYAAPAIAEAFEWYFKNR